jgi:hypothetical protein
MNPHEFAEHVQRKPRGHGEQIIWSIQMPNDESITTEELLVAIRFPVDRRELFAAMAMQGLRASKLEGGEPRSLWRSDAIAKLAVKDADALIDALEQPK